MFYDKYHYSVNHIKKYKCYQSNIMYTLNLHYVTYQIYAIKPWY